MKFHFYPRTDKYTWSLCLVLTTISSTLSMAALAGVVNSDSVWSSFFGMFVCVIYGIVCARQAYVYKRKWPQKSMMLFWPFSLSNLINPYSVVMGIWLTAFNLLLWFISYKLARNLAANSLY